MDRVAPKEITSTDGWTPSELKALLQSEQDEAIFGLFEQQSNDDPLFYGIDPWGPVQHNVRTSVELKRFNPEDNHWSTRACFHHEMKHASYSMVECRWAGGAGHLVVFVSGLTYYITVERKALDLTPHLLLDDDMLTVFLDNFFVHEAFSTPWGVYVVGVDQLGAPMSGLVDPEEDFVSFASVVQPVTGHALPTAFNGRVATVGDMVVGYDGCGFQVFDGETWALRQKYGAWTSFVCIPPKCRRLLVFGKSADNLLAPEVIYDPATNNLEHVESTSFCVLNDSWSFYRMCCVGHYILVFQASRWKISVHRFDAMEIVRSGEKWKPLCDELVAQGIVKFIVGGEEFHVHLGLLQRYEYFKRLFDSGFCEQSELRVEVPDMEPHVFTQMVNFMYQGVFECGLPLRILASLLVAGDKYIMKDLRKRAQLELSSACREAASKDSEIATGDVVAVFTGIFSTDPPCPALLSDALMVLTCHREILADPDFAQLARSSPSAWRKVMSSVCLPCAHKDVQRRLEMGVCSTMF